MTPGAGVHALDALKEWYAALAEFRTDASNGLTSIALALQRAGDWLLEQQQHWQRQIRKAEEEVVQAKTDLRNCSYKDRSGHHPDTTVQEENLEQALARLEFCHDQLDTTRRWMTRLPTVIQDVYDGPGRRFGFFLDTEMPRALAQLAGQLGALDQYLNLQTQASAPPVAEPASDQTARKEPLMMLDGGRGMIYSALKNIQAKWDVVEPYWGDVMRLKFEEQVWTPLQQQTHDALEAIDQLQVFLHQMRRECEGISFDIHASD